MTEWTTAPAFCPELDLNHVCNQIVLIEEKVEDLNTALQNRIRQHRSFEIRDRVMESLGNNEHPSQIADVGMATADRVQATRRQAPDTTCSKITCPTQGSDPACRQNAPLSGLRPAGERRSEGLTSREHSNVSLVMDSNLVDQQASVIEGTSGESSTLRTQASTTAGPSRLLMEVKVAVWQKEDGVLELNVVRDGGVLVWDVQEDYTDAFGAEARVRGPCPDCRVLHVWEKRKRQGSGMMQWPSDQFRNCPLFLEMSPAQKAAWIEHARGCPKCTSWKHVSKDCSILRNTICKVPVGTGVCNKPHHSMLHGSGNAYCQANHCLCFSNSTPRQSVLLEVQRVLVVTMQGSEEGVVIFDHGSNLTFCPHDWAKKAGWPSMEVLVYIKGCPPSIRGWSPRSMRWSFWTLMGRKSK